jgi:FtsH-binding integral membrane protein
MLIERLAGGLLFAASLSSLFARYAHRKASRRRPFFTYDVWTALAIIVLFFGITTLTGVQVLDFSTTNPAP